MADISKLRPRSRLGAPPPLTEASPNLEAPEIAPAPQPEPERTPTRAPRPAAAAPVRRTAPVADADGGGEEDGELLDGRSARRTGRTVQFATRVSPEFNRRVRKIAEVEGMLLVEVLERALAAYEAAHPRKK